MAKIALIPGDGIGVDVTREAAKLLRCVASKSTIPLELSEWDLGAERYLRTGISVTDEEMAQLAAHDAIFLGAMGDARVPDNKHARDILLGMRFRFDLYINLRPVRLLDARFCPLKDVKEDDIDIVIFRENTEGLYVGIGGAFKRGTADEVATETDVNTRKGVERIIRAAFEYARTNKRERVTLTDKANAMENAGQLWRRVFKEVAAEYSEIKTNAVYVDALALDLVRRPAAYDVIVAGNLFGDIISDLAAALVGGLGLAPSANLHPGRAGLFEPVHGSAPDLVGTGKANPLAAILTVGLMLQQLGHPELNTKIEAVVQHALKENKTTPDLGGSMNCSGVGDWICENL
ncbi:MAG TPA: 3-isopropylmalate dehydrogenase [Longimicrobiales bacterium]|nr:3-isopropylmalate dehydrogenase [Longimicrobiales bacterium]